MAALSPQADNRLDASMASTRVPFAGEWDTRTRCAVPDPGKEAGKGPATRLDYLPLAQSKPTPPRESGTMPLDTVFHLLLIVCMRSSHLVMPNTYLANAFRMVRSVLRTLSR